MRRGRAPIRRGRGALFLNEVLRDVMETLLQRVEWTTGSRVLLDDEPLTPGGLGSCDDFLEV